jgi:hypothetical protein
MVIRLKAGGSAEAKSPSAIVLKQRVLTESGKSLLPFLVKVARARGYDFLLYYQIIFVLS